MIINTSNLVAITTGYKAAYNEGFHGAEPAWQKIATEVPSTTRSNTYAWLGQAPGLREWLGDRHIKSITAHGYTITNKKFESTVGVQKDDIEDDQYGIYKPLMQEMGYAAAVHPDELIFGLVKDGFSTKCYDGQYFFDSDHPVGGTSVTNVQTGSNPAWFLLDTSRALKPLILQKRKPYTFTTIIDAKNDTVFNRDEYRYGVDGRSNAGFGFWQQAFGSQKELTRENFRTARAAMLALKSDEGRPLGIKPTLLLVGPSNGAAARDLILAERDSGGKTNTDRNLVEIVETGWLA